MSRATGEVAGTFCPRSRATFGGAEIRAREVESRDVRHVDTSSREPSEIRESYDGVEGPGARLAIRPSSVVGLSPRRVAEPRGPGFATLSYPGRPGCAGARRPPDAWRYGARGTPRWRGLREQSRPRADDHGPFDNVAQLAHVARPRVDHQGLGPLPGRRLNPLPHRRSSGWVGHASRT